MNGARSWSGGLPEWEATIGFGDQILGSGMARGAHARGKRIAFGDGSRIIWNSGADLVFRGNPNIAWLGSEGAKDLEWIPYFKGHRIYNQQVGNRWIWNYEFKPTPGEMYFSDDEIEFAALIKPGFILIEPNVPWEKTVASNKDWGIENYQRAADQLMKEGHRVVQFAHGKKRIKGAEVLDAADYRFALAALARAALYIGPEGGLHHGAAAVGTKGVVLFGGFVTPQVTGYDMHRNLTGGAEACGSIYPCAHCKQAMAKISVDEVIEAARERMAA